MIFAGCDVGSTTAKAVILRDGRISGSAVLPTGANPERAASDAMAGALREAGLRLEEVRRCVGTGYGRKRIPFGDALESEIACHARGAVWQCPGARTLVDIGGQDAKAVRFDPAGSVSRYQYNDKCAAGTGRFLETIAAALDVALEDLGSLSARSREHLTLSNQCVVFAETEILSLVNDGRETADIVRALHQAAARRATAMARAVGVEREVVMAGGVARNAGMFEALQEALGVPLRSLPHPQLNGAIGAALLAAGAGHGAAEAAG
jgi:predicted CoA-substrate-specific enzyme activase